MPDCPKPKLLLEHDAKKPIGRMVSYREDEDGMYATFKISNTTRGTDALIEASEQLRSGLSVGVEVIDGKRDGGVYRVLSSKMMETSLVQATDKPNANRRIYPYQTLFEQVQKYIAGPIAENRALGELDYQSLLANINHNHLNTYFSQTRYQLEPNEGIQPKLFRYNYHKFY